MSQAGGEGATFSHKPRRPPEHPVFRGLVWRNAAADRMHAGDPLAQWSYVCPSHPEGLEATHVIRSSFELQTEVVWTWFNANFEPFNENGPWFRLDDPDWGFGTGQLAPEYRTASDILAEEFQGVAANPVVGEVAKLLAGKSRFWILVERPPEPEPASPQAVVRAALEPV